MNSKSNTIKTREPRDLSDAATTLKEEDMTMVERTTHVRDATESEVGRAFVRERKAKISMHETTKSGSKSKRERNAR